MHACLCTNECDYRSHTTPALEFVPTSFNKPEPGLTAPDRLIRCMQLGPIHANRVAAGHVGQLRKLADTVRILPAARLVHFARTQERWQNLTLNAPEKAHASTQAPPPAHTHLLYPTPPTETASPPFPLGLCAPWCVAQVSHLCADS